MPWATKFIQRFNLWYNKLARQKLLEFPQEYSPQIHHMPGNKNNFWGLSWNLQFVHYIQPMSPSLSLYFTYFLFSSKRFCLSPGWCGLPYFHQHPRVFPSHTGHRRFPTDYTEPITQQVQPMGSDSDSSWAFAAFCHLVRPYNHLCSSRSSSFWASSWPSGLSFHGKQNSREGVSSNSHLHVQLGCPQPTHRRPRPQSYTPW